MVVQERIRMQPASNPSTSIAVVLAIVDEMVERLGLTAEVVDLPIGAELIELEECIHHWLIEPPAGIYSVGYCKKCFEIRKFSNKLTDLKD